MFLTVFAPYLDGRRVCLDPKQVNKGTKTSSFTCFFTLHGTFVGKIGYICTVFNIYSLVKTKKHEQRRVFYGRF